MEYTAKVNSFMPAFTIPFLAWAATIAETLLGITLILGIWLRFVALAAAGLLVLFGTAMAISLGIKTPLDYSVFSASAGALLLAICQIRAAEAEVKVSETKGRRSIKNRGPLTASSGGLH
jgi:uncharacterized membrane protein YphA (DoxX/SURF4 family)